MLSLSHQVALVLVVVDTMVWFHSNKAFLLKNLLQSPAKAIGSVLIDSLNHQQNRSKLEDRCTNESCPSTSICDLATELG